MAEQTFKSPGFFEREIDLSQTETSVSGVPAGIAGISKQGPAFVPVTVGSMIEFENKFGGLDPDMFGPYAVNEFLKHRSAVTYVRVLGAGANFKSADFTLTDAAGTVRGAGFAIKGQNSTSGPDKTLGSQQGCVQFLAARHFISSSEAVGYPIFSDNTSTPLTDSTVNLVRGVLMTPSGTRFQVQSYRSGSYANVGTGSAGQDDFAWPSSTGLFKLILSSTAGTSFSADEGNAGIKIFTASLDPDSKAYIGKILNTDPLRFQSEQHLLYADFPVVKEIAEVDRGSSTRSWAQATGSIALVSGSGNSSKTSGLSINFRDAFGRFDTRYTTATTTFFISQPFGDIEYDLFRFETISDGAKANTAYKISIRDIRKPQSPGQDPYATFTVEVRAFSDNDRNPQVLERYPGCTLNPSSEDYIASKIGDYKAYFNFDAEIDSEKRVVVSGRYPNRSSRVRVVTSNALDSGGVPTSALPFGFRGLPALKTSDTLTDDNTKYKGDVRTVTNGCRRLAAIPTVRGSENPAGADPHYRHIAALTASIVPPVPMRYKVTRGLTDKTGGGFAGSPGQLERSDARLYWGVKFERISKSGSNITDTLYRTNLGSNPDGIISSYSKFLGIQKLDILATGSGADLLNNNKFTLAKVALSNKTTATADLISAVTTAVTGTAAAHMVESAYIRNGTNNTKNYALAEGTNTRLTLASLAALTSSIYFNKFVDYAKFTNMFYGGFDGTNILDKNMSLMNDKASSSDTGGYASGAELDIGLNNSANGFGVGKKNSIIQSYRTAARILTSPISSRVNILVVPGIKDSALSNYILDRLKDYGKAIYLMDIPSYDASDVRLFTGDTNSPSIDKTASNFASRGVDNNYAATYFPDVRIVDEENNRRATVPSSIAALGALAYNDRVAYPWFAPAGFNRGSLGFVTNLAVRLNQDNRDTLYENRINPIASFPNAGFVIFGQKTLQILKSSLDRVNVRRMLLEVRRIIGKVAENIVFEQNTPATRSRFVAEVTPLLSLVQSQQGVDQFRVVMDSSNNTQTDIENNILNGRIVIVPTRAVEFIAIDFIITNAGVEFV
jgi:hypothetical protein